LWTYAGWTVGGARRLLIERLGHGLSCYAVRDTSTDNAGLKDNKYMIILEEGVCFAPSFFVAG
jgi:hypothetical protein